MTRNLRILAAVLLVLWAAGFFALHLGISVPLLLAATIAVTFYNVMKAGDKGLPG